MLTPNTIVVVVVDSPRAHRASTDRGASANAATPERVIIIISMRRAARLGVAARALLALLAIASRVASPARAASDAIDVALTANWRSTSRALEALEAVADATRGAGFWPLVRALDADADADVDVDACEAYVRARARAFVPSAAAARVMELAMGARAYSPRLEAFRAMGDAATRDGTGGDDARVACCRVQVGDDVFTEVEALVAAMDGMITRARGEPFARTERDHAYATFDDALPTAVLYASPGTACFSAMHDTLAKASDSRVLNYVLRPVLFDASCARANSCAASGVDGNLLRLSGFGIELAVKNMEYKAIDDSKIKSEGGEGDEEEDEEHEDEDNRASKEVFADEPVAGFNFATLAARYPESTDALKLFRDDMKTKLSLASDAPLKVWDIKDLGIQAAQRVALSSDPISALVDVSQNFPSLADSLSRMPIDKTFAKEVRRNHRKMQPGGLVMSLNGEQLELDTVDVYALVESIAKEVGVYEELVHLGLPSTIAKSLLRIPKKENQVKINTDNCESIVFYNDVEKDPKFERWSKDVKHLASPSPGGFPRVRRNLYTVVAILDPTDHDMWDMIDMMDQMVEAQMPIRMAQVVVTGARDNTVSTRIDPSDAKFGERIALAANYLMRAHGAEAQRDFLSAISMNRQMLSEPSYFAPATYAPPTWALARQVLVTILSQLGGVDADVEAFIASAIESTKRNDASRELEHVRRDMSRKGLNAPSVLLNGEYVRDVVARAHGATLASMLNHFLRLEMSRVKTMFTQGAFDGVDDVSAVVTRGASEKYVPWILDEAENPPVYSAPVPYDVERVLDATFASAGDAEEFKPMSIVVIANADTKSGARLIAEVSKYALSDAGSAVRFTVAHPGGSAPLAGERARAVQAALLLPSRRAKILLFLSEICGKGVDADDAATSVGLNAADFKRLMDDDDGANEISQAHARLVAHYGIKSKCTVIANGRVLDLTFRQCEMDADDFAVLAAVEMEQRSSEIHALVMKKVHAGELDAELGAVSRIVSRASAIVAVKQASSPRKRSIMSLETMAKDAKRTAFKSGTGAAVEIEAILDPLSKEAQRVAPVLALLRDRLSEDVCIRVILNPRVNLADLPLKSYYRYVAPPKLFIESPGAHITDVPTHKTLTMHVDFPESWMVTTHKATYDLDNLILKDAKDRVIRAEYRLESILVTGHASDERHQPARGTQMILEDDNTRATPGTIVMANLGYFQLPASPGMHKLSLRAGRSANIFKFEAANDLTDTAAFDRRISENATSVDVFVDSFRGRVLEVNLKRRPGREKSDVLLVAKTGPASWISNIFKKSDNRIHIFSVASGHLYERFLKIMMASVKRSTKEPVKFWFIKNWLSPSFKDYLPYMAKEYDFEFELISYKWPTWLNKQTEKQRIIWAYKILFLDVLFPLELKKVIFVDADQIVRADMAELWNMDLKGAPYGYTPMCDNNKEMEGFRFWKQGFWASHLRGKPYHISALYVVDLDRFREIAAGDRLRGMYDQLSRDPGSLANLDQDLPNFAQHEVPIFSLPQPWLWCESWCGNETKAAAKTIDLCNNPLTKEPKLEGARRIVAEWPELDDEVRAFTARVERGELSNPSAIPVAKDEL